MLSTGMSSMEQIEAAVKLLGTDRLMLAHATSTYPVPKVENQLRGLSTTLREMYPCPIGYSGHEVGLATTRLPSCWVRVCGTPYHARSGHVGQRSGRVDGAARVALAS